MEEGSRDWNTAHWSPGRAAVTRDLDPRVAPSGRCFGTTRNFLRNEVSKFTPFQDSHSKKPAVSDLLLFLWRF